jgi:hypothetical protein
LTGEEQPNAEEILRHPMFWTLKKTLEFFQATSDRLQLDLQQRSKRLYPVGEILESRKPAALAGKWLSNVDKELHYWIKNDTHRKYDTAKIKDLLCLLRNWVFHGRIFHGEGSFQGLNLSREIIHWGNLPKSLNQILFIGLVFFFSSQFYAWRC